MGIVFSQNDCFCVNFGDRFALKIKLFMFKNDRFEILKTEHD